MNPEFFIALARFFSNARAEWQHKSGQRLNNPFGSKPFHLKQVVNQGQHSQDLSMAYFTLERK